jgi:hypothetical protein
MTVFLGDEHNPVPVRRECDIHRESTATAPWTA